MALVGCFVPRPPSSLLLGPLPLCAAVAGLCLLSLAPACAEDLVLPALAPEPFVTTSQDGSNFWTQPHLFGDWGGLRSRLAALGVKTSLTGVDEAVGNLSGGERQIVQEAGQVGLQVNLDLAKIIGLQGGAFETTLVSRWGRDLAADAGIPALQLLNEVYGRGNIVRLERFVYKQKLFDDRVELTLGRLAFGDEFFSFPCDFINLTFCGAPPGNVVGSYIYNWPVSQWAAVAKVYLRPDLYLKAGILDANPAYLDTTPSPALYPTVPSNSQGILVPVELGWKPKFGALAGDYKVGGWWNNSAAPNAATSLNGEPILISGLPGLPGNGRYGFSAELRQQVSHDPASTDAKSGLSVFFNATYADRRTSAEDYQIALGVTQQGVGATRPQDSYGLAVGTTHVNPNIAYAQSAANSLGIGPGFVQGNEYVMEAFYGWQATGWLNLKFSAQYVILPGGYTAPDNRNAFVLGVRTSVDF
jgi:porin